MILAGEDTAATRYLSKFSRLLRLVLVHSDKETITLKEELVTLGLYVELEALRFKEARSEEHTSELQSLMRISYAVFCLKKKKRQYYTKCKKNTTRMYNEQEASNR